MLHLFFRASASAAAAIFLTASRVSAFLVTSCASIRTADRPARLMSIAMPSFMD